MQKQIKSKSAKERLKIRRFVVFLICTLQITVMTTRRFPTNPVMPMREKKIGTIVEMVFSNWRSASRASRSASFVGVVNSNKSSSSIFDSNNFFVHINLLLSLKPFFSVIQSHQSSMKFNCHFNLLMQSALMIFFLSPALIWAALKVIKPYFISLSWNTFYSFYLSVVITNQLNFSIVTPQRPATDWGANSNEN